MDGTILIPCNLVSMINLICPLTRFEVSISKKLLGGETPLKLTMQVSQWRLVIGKVNKYSVLITWLKKFHFKVLDFWFCKSSYFQKYPVSLQEWSRLISLVCFRFINYFIFSSQVQVRWGKGTSLSHCWGDISSSSQYI